MTARVTELGPVLVTGSEGFIGRALVAALVAAGRKVVALDLAPVAARADHAGPGQVVPVAASVTDAEVLTTAAQSHDVTAIVNLAGLIIPACRRDPILGAEVNILGHVNIFELARRMGISRLVYTSTIAAKPRPPHGAPVNLYGAYKRCCEEIAKVYHVEHGLASVGLRPNVVYGPGREVGETAFVSQAMAAAARGEAFEMPFCGEMCFQHIDEVVDVIIRSLLAAPGGPLVSDITTETDSVDDVVAAIRAVVPGADLTVRATRRPAPSGLDNAALRDLLGEWPRIRLKAGARRTIAALAPGAAAPLTPATPMT